MKTDERAGYIKVYRMITEWQRFKDPRDVQILIYLLCRVNRETGRTRKGATINPGCIAVSQRQIADDLGCGHMTIHRHLATLAECGTIQLTSSKYGTIIKLNNWEKYQIDVAHQERTKRATNALVVSQPWPISRPPLQNKEKEKSTEDYEEWKSKPSY